MKKWSILFLLLVLGTGTLFAQMTATLIEVTGKVEIKTASAGWKAATKDMKISKGTTISTGFNSRVAIKIEGSMLYVNQLTRIDLDELVKQQSTVTAGISLKYGAIRADVEGGGASKYTLKSPVSTAAVRGTSFRYTGYRLIVKKGKIGFTNVYGQLVVVEEDQESDTDGSSPPSSTEDGKKRDFKVSATTGKADGRLLFGDVPTARVKLRFIWD